MAKNYKAQVAHYSGVIIDGPFAFFTKAVVTPKGFIVTTMH